jgi:molybdopterin molybdotransferase
MITEDEARAQILGSVRPLPGRRVALSAALDCFAGRDLVAPIALPNFDNSAMDGYAVVASASRKGNRLRVIGEQPAGEDRHLRVASGEAVRIFTGAPIPGGADAVIMQEDVTRRDDEIVENVDVDSGEFIRRRGCDLAEGQQILAKGERIRSVTLALLASQGIVDLEVGGEVRVSIISTGDELVAAGKPLQPGQIYDSNSILLESLVQRCGTVAESVQHCVDDRDALTEAIQFASKSHVLIITGGVSVGEHDLVQSALRDLGARIDIWRVAIKPGKPFLFARVRRNQTAPSPQSSERSAWSRSRGGREAPGEGSVDAIRDCIVFGLPGNAVSAFVTFLRFVRPAILMMMGAAESELALPKIPAQLEGDLTNDGDRTHYFRGRVDDGKFKPVGRQESHALFGLSQSNAILQVRPGETFDRGALVNVEIWD